MSKFGKLNNFVGGYHPAIWEPLSTNKAVFYLMSDMAHIANTLEKVVCKEHTLRDDTFPAVTMSNNKTKKQTGVFYTKYVKPKGIGK